MKYKVRKQISVLMLVAVIFCLIGLVPVQAAENEETQDKVLNFTISSSSVETSVKLYNIESDNDVYMIIFKNIQSDGTEVLYFGFYSMSAFSANFDQINKRNGEVENEYYGHSLQSACESVDLPSGETVYIHRYSWVSGIYPSPNHNISGDLAGTVTFNNMTDINDMYVSVYNVLTTGKDSNYEKYVPEYDNGSASYNSELGHLQNIACSTLVTDSNSVGDKTNNTANRYSGNKTWKYTYSYATSTGFDLRQDGADVQYCVKIKGGYTTMTGSYNSLPTVVSDYCYVGNECNYFYIGANGLSLNDLYAEFRTDASMWAKTIDDTVYVYMRPVYCNGSKWTYGEWAKFYFKDGSFVNDGVVEIGTTSTGGISSEDDGVEDDFQTSGTDTPQVSIGEGTDLDDAESNVKPSGSSASIGDDVFQNIQSLVSQIGQIPAIIAKIFSFLPSWCLALVAVGFSMVVFLIIYKLIRG